MCAVAVEGGVTGGGLLDGTFSIRPAVAEPMAGSLRLAYSIIRESLRVRGNELARQP